jgi:Meckel syndrome type 1 protein
MVPVAQHSPVTAADEHATLVVALDAGDLAGADRDRALALTAACAGCASLLGDLAAIRAATAALPAPARRRDYRLTEADAARLRPTPWRRFVHWLGAPQSSVRPLAGVLATLGIAGLLLSTTPGLFGQAATTASMAAAPLLAPNVAGAAASAADGSARVGVAPSPASAPAAAAGVAPGATSEPGIAGGTPGLAALPAPSPVGVAAPAPSSAAAAVPESSPGIVAVPASSPAAIAVPVPTLPAAGIATVPAAGATAGPLGFSSNSGTSEAAPKAGPSQAPQAGRGAVQPATSEPAASTQTVVLIAGAVLLAFGIALFAANLVLRGRAEG